MIKMTLITILCFIFQVLTAPPNFELTIIRGEGINPYENIWKAVCKVESNSNPLAYNHTEDACGIVQIREIRLKDYNTRFKKKVARNALFEVKTSKEIFMAYCELYGSNTNKLIRDWNGSGPKTYEYLKRVKKYL